MTSTLYLDSVFKMKLEAYLNKHIQIFDVHSDNIKFEELKPSLASFQKEDGLITILNWSTLCEFSSIKHGRLDSFKIYGENIQNSPGQKDCFIVDKKQCFNPIDDEEGRILADYVGNLVAVTFDAFHVQNETLKFLLIYVLEKMKKITRKDANLIRKELLGLIGKITEGYNSWRFSRQDELNRKIMDANVSVQNFWKEIKRLENNTKGFRIELAGMSKIKPITSNCIRKMIKKIKKYPYVKAVKIHKHQMNIILKDIKLFDRNLGEYQIIIDSGLTFWVTSKFLSERKTTGDFPILIHPQVNTSSFLCGGNLDPKQTLYSGQLDIFVQAMWELLNNYNPRDNSIHGGMFLTVFDYLKKNPNKIIPGWFYETGCDDYWKPETVEKIFAEYVKKGTVNQWDFPYEENITGAD